jgi:outer membrane lipoprotein SlyB
MKATAILLSLAAALGLTGCPASMSGSTVSREDALNEMTVRMGVVDSVRLVQIEGTRTPVGAVAGGIIGGIAGSNMGRGSGATVGAVAGTVAGGVAGSAIEQGVTRQQGLEITIRLDNGQLIAVTQAADEDFRPGDRVRVLSGRGTTRVSR